jgi:hypothetical protein
MAKWIKQLSNNEPNLTRNIVIFGQTGAGKRSIIDMLACSSVTQLSNDDQRHSISHEDGNTYRFWDVDGLNEDKEAPALSQWVAIQDLRSVVGAAENVNLLIYCIHGRLLNILPDNYDLFWRIICRRKVPIVLVVTGLEEKDDMDEWWDENQKTIEQMNVTFDGYACITSWKGKDYRYERKYKDSARKVWKLVKEHCRPEPWSMPLVRPGQARRDSEVERYMVCCSSSCRTLHINNNMLFIGTGYRRAAEGMSASDLN